MDIGAGGGGGVGEGERGKVQEGDCMTAAANVMLMKQL